MTKYLVINEPGWDKVRIWEVQKPPYNATLPVSYHNRYNTGNFGYGSNNPSNHGPDLRDADLTVALNKCYESFNSQTKDQSQWANNLIEARESVGMISSKAAALSKAAVALQKQDYRGVANAFGIVGNAPGVKRVGKIVRSLKSFGNKWLELHFGWVPLAEDIFAGTRALTAPDFGRRRIQAHSSTSSELITHELNGRYPGGPFAENHYDYRWNTTVKMGAYVRITNHNAFLANQLGVVNPLSVAWEAVPYSFVVDWFGNVGQCLSAMTDGVGLAVEQAFTNQFQVATLKYDDRYFNGDPFSPDNHFWGSSGTSVYWGRGSTIQGPTLHFNAPKLPSCVRAATAISLLSQHLRSFGS